MYLANRNPWNDSNLNLCRSDLTWCSEHDASRTMHIPCSTDLETRCPGDSEKEAFWKKSYDYDDGFGWRLRILIVEARAAAEGVSVGC
jgi:hypothetical protein